MLFKDIIGQKKIIEKLIGTVHTGRISHAQLFWGKGVNGKFALALAYAQYLNCTNRSHKDSCGACANCRKYQSMAHPDLFFSFPVNTKTKNSKDKKGEKQSEGGVGSDVKVSELISTMFYKDWIEFIRQESYYPDLQKWYKKIGLDSKQGNINKAEARRLVKDLSYKPTEAQYKVLIMWYPEKMNLSAANVLLKFFEEPPKNTLIILVAEEKELLIKTIQSRFQLTQIPKIEDNYLQEFLISKYKQKDKKAIESFVAISNGDLAKAFNYLDGNTRIKEDFLMFQSWMRLCYKKGSLEGIKDFVEKISRIGRENQKHFLMYALRIFRESLLINYGDLSLARLTSYEKEWLEKFASFVHINNAEEMIKKVDEAINEIGRNASASILFMKLSLDMSVLLKTKS
jgi:DNA polymerase-3 subunit delta'